MKSVTTFEAADDTTVSGQDRFEPAAGAVHAPGAIVGAGLIAGSMLIAVVLRWFHLGELSIWWDEGMTALAASLSPFKIIRFVQADTFPPLYFLLLHYWAGLFGDSESALRSLSAVSGTISIGIFYLLAKKVLQDTLAVALAMWLFAFSVLQLWYSQEARPYAMISLLALVALYALILFLEKRSLGLFAIIVLAIDASLYSHTMMFFYLLALNVTWLTYPSQRAWMERVKELLLADVLAVGLYLPWVPSLLAQVAGIHGHPTTWSALPPTIATFFKSLGVICGFNLEYLTAFAGKRLPFSSHALRVSIAGGVGLLCAALAAGGLWRVAKADRNKNVSLLLYCLAPMLAVFAYSRISTPVFVDRIFIASSAVFPIVLAYPLAAQKGRRGRIVYASLAIVLGVVTALSGAGFLRYQQKEDWRGVTSSLLKIPEKNRLIVFVARTGERLFDYYAQRFPVEGPGITKMGVPNSYLDAFPPPDYSPITSQSDFTPLQLAVESRKYSEIDLVLTHEQAGDPNHLVVNYLNRVLILQGEQQFYGVKVFRFLTPPR